MHHVSIFVFVNLLSMADENYTHEKQTDQKLKQFHSV